MNKYYLLALALSLCTLSTHAQHNHDIRELARNLDQQGRDLSDSVTRYIYRKPARYWDERRDLADEVRTLFEVQRLSAAASTLALFASGSADTTMQAVPIAFAEVRASFTAVHDQLLEADEAHCNWDIADQLDEDLHLFQDSLREMRHAMRQLGLIERRRPAPVAPIPVVVEPWPPVVVQLPASIRIGETQVIESETAQFIVNSQWPIAQLRITSKGGYSRYIRVKAITVVTVDGKHINHAMYEKLYPNDSHVLTFQAPLDIQQVHVTVVHKSAGLIVDAVPVARR